jgi:hypothetical protein
MGKTSKVLSIAVIAAAVIFLLAGCDNPAMEPNETEYMYSDLSIEKAVWEVTSMSSMGGMTSLHITLIFDEPVRSDRPNAAWDPFTVNFDYSGGSPLIITSPQNPDVNSSFTRIRGEEKTVYSFSITFTGVAENADTFSNVRLSYMAPASTKIVGLSNAELKDFMNKPVTQKGAGGGMGGH